MAFQNDAPLTSTQAPEISSDNATPQLATDNEAHAAKDAALHQAARGAESRTGSTRSMRDYTSTAIEMDSSKAMDLECRPRTTVLATADVEEMSAPADSDLLADLQYSSDPIYPPTDGEATPCHSAPTTPTVFVQPSTSAVQSVAEGRSQKPFSQNASSGPGSPTPRIFKRAHRSSGSSFHSTDPVHELRQEEAAPAFKLKPIIPKPNRERKRSNSVPPQLALSPRSASLAAKRAAEAPDDEPASKRSRSTALDLDAKVAKAPKAAKAQPLSQHQLYTLHQLNLPRPAFLTDSFTASRTWTLRKGSSKSSSSIYGNAEIYVPTLAPPITRHTLRELDLSEILRNPQLRHDIVFDSSLAFRPNVDGDRGAKKLLASERFWTAITREVSVGCRCTAFENGSSEPLRCVCSAVGFSPEAVKSLVGRDAPSQTGKVIFNAVPLATRLPSRIPPLVKELRSVLLSLLPAHASGPFDHAGTIDDQASRKIIQATLDPALISQEVEHGVLDVASLGRFLGHTLKLHCAPMRDEMVDTMVACIESSEVGNSEVARGLRMAFEILELMKLDIANHQLRTLRPYLLDTAVDFELRSYLECADRRKSRAMEKTLAWVNATTWRTGFREPADLVRSGLLELLFRPDTRPPSPSRARSRRSKHSLSPSPSSIPETLQLDTHRLQTLHSDLTDLSVVYMLLMLFTQVAAPKHVSDSQLEVIRREIWIIMHSNGIARSTAGLSPVTTSAADADSPACSPHLSCAGWKKLQDERFKESLQDVVLRLAVRVKMVQLGHSIENEAPCSVLPDASTLDLMTRWLDTHLKPSDPLYCMLQDRLQATIDAMLSSTMDKHSTSQQSWWIMSVAQEEPACEATREHCSSLSARHFDPAAFSLGVPLKKRAREEEEDEEEPPLKRPKLVQAVSQLVPFDYEAAIEALLKRNGLSTLRHECQVVSERIGRVATFHLDAYKSLYQCMIHQQQQLLAH